MFLTRTKSKKVGVIDLRGVIFRNEGRNSHYLDLESVRDRIDEVAKMNLLAVALRINSPGGSPGQSELIYRYLIEKIPEETPVFGFVEDIAASGGYMVACAADEIFALETSLVGSIGVMRASFGFHQLITMLGVERRIQMVGKNKVRGDSFLPRTEEDDAVIARVQQAIYDPFVKIVKDSRGGRLAPQENPEETLFSGDIWAGQGAFQLGLVDGIGSLESILAYKFGEVEIFYPKDKKPGYLDLLFGSKSDTKVDLLDQIETRLHIASVWGGWRM